MFFHLLKYTIDCRNWCLNAGEKGKYLIGREQYIWCFSSVQCILCNIGSLVVQLSWSIWKMRRGGCRQRWTRWKRNLLGSYCWGTKRYNSGPDGRSKDRRSWGSAQMRGMAASFHTIGRWYYIQHFAETLVYETSDHRVELVVEVYDFS